MKKQIHKLILSGFIFFQIQVAGAQTAELQFIHNAADPALDTVDIYVNGVLASDNFAFRSATTFLTFPSGVAMEIGFAPDTSTSVADTIKNFSVTLASGDRYIAVAIGVLIPANFALNPDGSNIDFTILLKNNIRNAAINPTDIDFVAFHGTTDAQTVDLLARNVGLWVDSSTYGNVTGYLSVTPADYILDVTPANANDTILVSFHADLLASAGQSAVIFGSGFVDPFANQNGAFFGLFAAFASGTVVEFQLTSQAKLQFIHNAADPAANALDIYADGSLLLDNFVFQTASPFIDILAGSLINIGIAPSNSASVNDTLKNFEQVFINGQNHVAMVNGVLTPGSFASNPGGANTGLKLIVQDNIRLKSQTAGNTEFIFIQGITDAPTKDIVARNTATLVDNSNYTDISNYISLQSIIPGTNYYVDIADSGQTTIDTTYGVDLSLYADSSAVFFTSGFIDTSSVNQNGPGISLFAAFPDGSVISWISVDIAFLQAIHNCSDPVADSLDIYALGFLAVDNFKYRTATAYLAVPAGLLLNVGVALGNSSSVNDTIKNLEVILENGKNYIAMAIGVIDTSNFAANPDGKDISFNLLTVDYARLISINPGNVDYLGIQACTDAPALDIIESNGGPILVDNAAFADITPYIPVTAISYNIDVTPGNDNTIIIGSFLADFDTLDGQAAVVFSSGFLDPPSNQNGPVFGLWAALKDGTVFPLTNITGIEDFENSNAAFSLSPNPAHDYSIVSFKNNIDHFQEIIITSATGQVVGKYNLGKGTSNIKIQTAGLNKGLYFIKVIGEDKVSVRKLMVE